VGGYCAVKFSLPSGWSKARLVKARFYRTTWATEVKVHIFASDGVTELTTPFNHDMKLMGWSDVDLTSRSIIVTGDFYVAFEWLEVIFPILGHDQHTAWSGRSYWKGNTADSWKQQGPPTNYMIRAVVEEPPRIGGVVSPINTLAIVAPYLAAIGLVAAVAIKKRRN